MYTILISNPKLAVAFMILSDLPGSGFPRPLTADAPEWIQSLGIFMAGISFAVTGLMLAAAGFFPEQAERYKRQIPTIISGLVMIFIAGTIMSIVGG